MWTKSVDRKSIQVWKGRQNTRYFRATFYIKCHPYLTLCTLLSNSCIAGLNKCRRPSERASRLLPSGGDITAISSAILKPNLNFPGVGTSFTPPPSFYDIILNFEHFLVFNMAALQLRRVLNPNFAVSLFLLSILLL